MSGLMDEFAGFIRFKDVEDFNMRIVAAYPPNIKAISAKFPAALKPGVLFAYGDTIFNPSDHWLPPSLLAHESTHAIQQRKTGVDEWWRLYMEDEPKFRFEQELEAHRVEIECFTTVTPGRQFRRRYIAGAAERLAGPLYGHVVTKSGAIALLKSAAVKGKTITGGTNG